jgi:hypothetical protein
MFQEKNQRLYSHAGIKGHCHVQLLSAYNEDGTRYREHGRFARRLKEDRVIHNTITELMDAHVADQMSDQGEAAIGFMNVGTGSGQGAADTGLAVELDRNALDSTTQGAAGDDNDVIYVCTWAAGDGTGAITEAGIMRADNNTTMMAYADFAVVNKLAADSMVITWTITFGAS